MNTIKSPYISETKVVQSTINSLHQLLNISLVVEYLHSYYFLSPSNDCSFSFLELFSENDHIVPIRINKDNKLPTITKFIPSIYGIGVSDNVYQTGRFVISLFKNSTLDVRKGFLNKVNGDTWNWINDIDNNYLLMIIIYY